MCPSVISPDERPWLTRPHAPGEPARHVAELTDVAGMAHVRANGDADLVVYAHGWPPEAEHAELLDSAV